jgi:hypothetical protein
MGKVLEEIDKSLVEFIAAQPLFFVATAPLSADGHINLSPKGLDTFRLLDPHRVAYLDLTGSGNETSAHLLENQRITFLFCAFSGAPRILRLYGRGRCVLPTSDEWPALALHFQSLPGARQIVVAQIERVQTSCGFAVPLLDFVGQRAALTDWAAAKGADGLETYRQTKNLRSVDGLPTSLGHAFDGSAEPSR